jgi:hypothetical protein
MSAIIEMIETVAGRLEELRDYVVFVGGATTTLLVTDPAVVDIRPTKDIDIMPHYRKFSVSQIVGTGLRWKQAYHGNYHPDW